MLYFYIIINSTYNNTHRLKNRLFEVGLKENKCECCGLTNWNGKDISLQIHHIDGDRTNNTIENLQILCPNCHSQTDTYAAKNIKKKKQQNNYCVDCNKIIGKYNIRCSNCNKKSFRKVIRPTKEELFSKIIEFKGNFSRLSKIYGVSDNAIRKWCLYYGIPSKSHDYKLCH